MEVVAVDRELLHKNLVAEYEKIIPKVTYRFGDKTVDEFGISECTICLEKFRDGEKLSKLPTCRHFFHTECILRWFMGEQQRESQKCPMCNLEVTVAAIKLANKQNLIDSPAFLALSRFLNAIRLPSLISLLLITKTANLKIMADKV
jgi:hypothetical protein